MQDPALGTMELSSGEEYSTAEQRDVPGLSMVDATPPSTRGTLITAESVIEQSNLASGSR